MEYTLALLRLESVLLSLTPSVWKRNSVKMVQVAMAVGIIGVKVNETTTTLLGMNIGHHLRNFTLIDHRSNINNVISKIILLSHLHHYLVITLDATTIMVMAVTCLLYSKNLRAFYHLVECFKDLTNKTHQNESHPVLSIERLGSNGRCRPCQQEEDP